MHLLLAPPFPLKIFARSQAILVRKEERGQAGRQARQANRVEAEWKQSGRITEWNRQAGKNLGQRQISFVTE